MHNIEFYTKPNCVYCVKARWHIQTFLPDWVVREEVLTDDVKQYLEDLYHISVKTVPQIIIGGKYVGGFTELVEYIENL